MNEEELIKLGWIPPDSGSEMMKILNSLVNIRENDVMETMLLAANYCIIADTVINSKDPIINRYLIRRNKDETYEDSL